MCGVISGQQQFLKRWGVCTAVAVCRAGPSRGGGRRVTVHRTKGQLQITQSGARQSTSRCTPGSPAPRPAPPRNTPSGTRLRPLPLHWMAVFASLRFKCSLICCYNENDYTVAHNRDDDTRDRVLSCFFSTQCLLLNHFNRSMKLNDGGYRIALSGTGRR